MVLESMLNPKNAEDKPWHVFFISLIYTFVAILFAYFLFPSETSLLFVALVTIIFVPFFQRLFVIEEKREDTAARIKGPNIFARHSRIIYVFSTFFLGVIAATTFVYVAAGDSGLFSLQTDTIRSFGSAAAISPGSFFQYLANNSQVMILMFILSVVFGAGAVFILAWNASVIAVYVGLFTKSMISSGTPSSVAYALGLPLGLGSIALHGIPEIVAYFVAGLAGGILSVGLIREKIGSRNFRQVAKDSGILLISAQLLILVAAYIEAF